MMFETTNFSIGRHVNKYKNKQAEGDELVRKPIYLLSCEILQHPEEFFYLQNSSEAAKCMAAGSFGQTDIG